MCTRKRRYRTQADALDAAMLVGVESNRPFLDRRSRLRALRTDDAEVALGRFL